MYKKETVSCFMKLLGRKKGSDRNEGGVIMVSRRSLRSLSRRNGVEPYQLAPPVAHCIRLRGRRKSEASGGEVKRSSISIRLAVCDRAAYMLLVFLPQVRYSHAL